MLCAFYHNSRKHKKENELLTGFKEEEKEKTALGQSPKVADKWQRVAAQVYIWNKTSFYEKRGRPQ